jgi:hypothetical protein
MWDTIQIILILWVYILTTYFGIRFISKKIHNFNIYLRLSILSFCMALFWGIGIAGSDGHPGFAFPAPNILAIGFMVFAGFYNGVLIGFEIFCIWLTLFFVLLLVRYFINKKKQVLNN